MNSSAVGVSSLAFCGGQKLTNTLIILGEIDIGGEGRYVDFSVMCTIWRESL